MPIWYWKLCLFSLLALLLSAWGDLVLITSLATAFMGFYVWVLFVNLWIIVALITPTIWAAQRGRLIYGLVVSIGLLAVPAIFAVKIIPDARAAVIAQNGERIEGRVEGLPVSIELDRSAWASGGCDGICVRLLEGPDVSWVRVRNENLRPIIYFMAPLETCLGWNPHFDISKPCIQFRKDDGTTSDLWVGRKSGPPKDARQTSDWVWATWVSKLVIEDRRGSPKLIAAASSVTGEEMFPFRLLPAMGAFNSSPASSISLLRETSGSSPEPDLADVLGLAGLRLAPA
jgi:hypothetical protein